jgi:hypothetical protein
MSNKTTATSERAVAAPTFSAASGRYGGALTVTLSDATAGATIYYTTDGTTPTTSSARYIGAIKVSSTQKVKAIAVQTGHDNSPASVATYTISGTQPAFTVFPKEAATASE